MVKVEDDLILFTEEQLQKYRTHEIEDEIHIGNVYLSDKQKRNESGDIEFYLQNDFHFSDSFEFTKALFMRYVSQ